MKRFYSIFAFLFVFTSVLPLQAATSWTDSTTVKAPAPFNTLVVPKGSVPATVDGTAAGGEYSLTGEALVGAVNGTFNMMTYRDGGGNEELQIYLEIADNTFSANDDVQLQFNLNNNLTVDAAIDREVRITREGVVTVGGLNTSGPPSSPSGIITPANVTNSPANWIVEIKILPADLGLNEIPNLFSFSIQVFDNDALNSGSYPVVALSDLNNWTNIETRYDIDYMVVLDRSGSMLNQNKWEDAKQAVDFFANTMSILRNPAFNDRIGLVTFDWGCSGSDNTASDNKSLAAISAFPVGNYADGSIGVPESDFCTPIGEGLSEAFDDLDATDDDDEAEKRRAVLLMSDGLQNKPSSTLDPAGAGYDPCMMAFGSPCQDSNIPVNAVAFGSGDGSVDTDLLSDIQVHYGGGFTTSNFNLTESEELIDSFLDGLGELYVTNTIHAGGLVDFPVTTDNEKLIAIAAWSNPANAEQIKLQNNAGGSFVDVDDAAFDVDCDFDTSVGFAFCSVAFPEGATWRIVADDGSFGANPTRVFGVVDLRLKADFATTPAQPETGDDLLLTVKLRDRGQPVLHDAATHPVKVSVNVQRPGESVGTFVSTTQPRTCDAITPVLPPVDPIIIKDPRRIPDGGVRAGDLGLASTGIQAVWRANGVQSAAAFSSLQAVADPDPPLFATVNFLLGSCRQGTALPRVSDPGLTLVDDGTQGDLVANDGIYSRSFSDTEIEGTYVFRFNVEGLTSDGQPFMRTKRQATYVRIHVDPEASDFGDRLVGQAGNTIVKEYYILPQDQFNGLMGPGKAHKVDFVISSGNGTFTNDVTDLGNGFYTRRIRYDASQGEPEVTTTVYGEPVLAVKKPLEIHLLAGGTFFDSDIALDNGLVVGARVGYGLSSHLVLEAEGAVTFTEVASVSGKAIQLFGNLRYDVNPNDDLVFFLTGGAGYILIRDFVAEDEAFAYHFGGGLTYWLSNKFGLRGDFRVINVEPLFNATSSTNFQATGALVFKL